MSLLVQELNLSGGSLEKRPVPNILPPLQFQLYYAASLGEPFYIRGNEDLMRY